MGKLSAQEFVKKLAGDSAFRKQLGITDEMSLAQFRAKAAAAGYVYAEAELAAGTRALSDHDLDGVAGGATPTRRARGIKY